MSTSESAAAPWSPARRVGFRFVFAYLVAYWLPSPAGIDVPGDPGEKAWHAVAPWVGAHVLHLAAPVTVQETGSGDTTYGYVKLLCTVALAVAATVVWSVLDRRTEHRSLHAWLRVWVRYALAATMLVYGVGKVFDMQFPFPSGEQLAESYGDSSPMRLLWTFMGFAPAYETFAGAAEVLGGALLFFRRTTTLGALIVAAVMSNVVMMNFCYDVPVKLGSTHLVLMAAFLLAPDLGRLARFFVLNRPTEPATLGPTLPQRWERVRLGAKVAVIALLLYQNGSSTLDAYREYGPGAPHGPLDGAYEVETFVRGGETVPPLPTEARRWRLVAFYPGDFMRAQNMDGTPKGFRSRVDEAAGQLTLSKPGPPPGPDEAPLAVLHYTQPDPGSLVLEGKLGDEPLLVRLKKLDAAKMPLVKRGFHWVQERPYNR